MAISLTYSFSYSTTFCRTFYDIKEVVWVVENDSHGECAESFKID